MSPPLLHAAAVHLPLALAAVVPLVFLGLFFTIRAGRLPPRAWVLGVLLQGLLMVGAAVALTSGNAAEERAEGLVAESLVDAHAQAAQVFTAVSAVVLAGALAALALVRHRVGFTTAGAATVLLGVVALGLAVRTGHQGGQLVHGAEASLAPAGAAAEGAAAPGALGAADSPQPDKGEDKEDAEDD